LNRVNQLRRVCELRRLEEQNRAALLEKAKKRLEQLDEALSQSRERQKAGRTLLEESVRTGDLELRIAGIEEMASGKCKAKVLLTRRQIVEESVRETRDRYFSKCKERCQAETVLAAALEAEVIIAERRSQAALDEWHRTSHRQPRWVAVEDEGSTESTRA
jgi:hypothetical protein